MCVRHLEYTLEVGASLSIIIQNKFLLDNYFAKPGFHLNIFCIQFIEKQVPSLYFIVSKKPSQVQNFGKQIRFFHRNDKDTIPHFVLCVCLKEENWASHL